MNLYAYCSNDGLNRTDPDGLTEERTSDATVVDLRHGPFHPLTHPREMAEHLFEQLGRDIASGYLYTPKFIESLGPYVNGPKAGTNEQRHHLTQDAAIIKEGAAAAGKNLALAINATTDLHKIANATQALAKQGGKLASELQVGYNALRNMGASPREAAALMITNQKHFQAVMNLLPESKTRIPGNRRRVEHE